MHRKSVCIVKTPFLQGKTEILYRKQDILKKIVLCIENPFL